MVGFLQSCSSELLAFPAGPSERAEDGESRSGAQRQRRDVEVGFGGSIATRVTMLWREKRGENGERPDWVAISVFRSNMGSFSFRVL